MTPWNQEAGEQMELDAWLTSRAPALVRIAAALCGDPTLAEDLAQSVLVKVIRKWSRIRRVENIDAYVRRMLVNEHLSWRRRRSSTEMPTDLAAHEQVSAQVSAGDHAEDLAERDRVRGLLGGLAPRARTALVLRYYADLSDDAIAEAMDITLSAVRASISRSLSSLRQHPTHATTHATQHSPVEEKR